MFVHLLAVGKRLGIMYTLLELLFSEPQQLYKVNCEFMAIARERIGKSKSRAEILQVTQDGYGENRSDRLGMKVAA